MLEITLSNDLQIHLLPVNCDYINKRLSFLVHFVIMFCTVCEGNMSGILFGIPVRVYIVVFIWMCTVIGDPQIILPINNIIMRDYVITEFMRNKMAN